MQVHNHKKEKVILVTGCSSGIGREICKRMKQSGYCVVATARDINSLQGLEADLKLQLDVTREESVQRAVGETIKKFQRIDLLINNAGYSMRGAIEEVPIDDAKNIFDVNVFGIIRLIQAVSPVMRERQSGRIVNIGSVSGRYTQAGNGNYCASKHAVEAISEAARLELAPYHVEVTVIEPGPMQTEFFHTLARNSDSLMKDGDSPYHEIYQADIVRRNRQKRMSSEIAAEKICNIILKKKVKTRYMIAVPYRLRMGLKILEVLK